MKLKIKAICVPICISNNLSLSPYHILSVCWLLWCASMNVDNIELFDSAGKSFVAEILMLRQVLSSGKMALLVLPYVSLCAEKVQLIK